MNTITDCVPQRIFFQNSLGVNTLIDQFRKHVLAVSFGKKMLRFTGKHKELMKLIRK